MKRKNLNVIAALAILLLASPVFSEIPSSSIKYVVLSPCQWSAKLPDVEISRHDSEDEALRNIEGIIEQRKIFAVDTAATSDFYIRKVYIAKPETEDRSRPKEAPRPPKTTTYNDILYYLDYDGVYRGNLKRKFLWMNDATTAVETKPQ